MGFIPLVELQWLRLSARDALVQGLMGTPSAAAFWQPKPGSARTGVMALPCGPGFLESHFPAVQGGVQR